MGEFVHGVHGTWGPKESATAEEQHRAALYVTSIARDTADATHLLNILGLLPAYHPAVMAPEDHGMRGYRIGCRCQICRRAKRNQGSRQRAAKKASTA